MSQVSSRHGHGGRRRASINHTICNGVHYSTPVQTTLNLSFFCSTLTVVSYHLSTHLISTEHNTQDSLQLQLPPLKSLSLPSLPSLLFSHSCFSTPLPKNLPPLYPSSPSPKINTAHEFTRSPSRTATQHVYRLHIFCRPAGRSPSSGCATRFTHGRTRPAHHLPQAPPFR